MAPARKTSDQQLCELLDFMERNVDIARAKSPHSPASKAVLLARWTELARQLNTVGRSKSPAYWRSYWHELKYKTKLKAMKMKKSIIDCENVRLPKLTEFEVRLLGILGVEVPKRPRSPIPVVVRRISESIVDAAGDHNNKPEFITQWESKFVETKTEPESHENNPDENEYEDSFPLGLNSEHGKYRGSDGSSHRVASDETDRVLTWARRLEVRRLEGERRLADALLNVANSQAELARTQRLLADALNAIRKDIQIYLRPERQEEPRPQQ